MDALPIISKKWILCSSLSLLGFFLLLLCVNHGPHWVGPTSLMTLGTALVDPVGGDHKLSRPDMVASPATNEGGDHRQVSKCDMFSGRWVYDPDTYPLYHAQQCPFLSDQVTCRKNGRPDSDYENWRWEPYECEIPRFNGREMLERWRGKRVVMVGDSLNRNQWESLSCILYSVLHPSRTYVDVRSAFYKVFQAKDYNCSVEFFWSPFLVQMEEARKKVIKLDRLPESARHWKGADIMVFNTGHWWVHYGNVKAWSSFEQKGKLEEEMEMERAYEIALTTWARWIESNVDPTKTSVFFRSISPQHTTGKQWCYNQTQPIAAAYANESYEEMYPKRMISITERRVRHMKSPVKYLDITRLSKYRKDAHTTVYTARQGKLLTEEQRKQPQTYADCGHWCLPGLPDTWNTLMYAWMVLDMYSTDMVDVAGHSFDRSKRSPHVE